ncbi:MAG: DUF1064 domain-containing protein [Sphingobacteriales bacterium]|nr:MAG: DUF1064 domain-containing protein [Sphingobacteriales bacterium]
MSIRFKIEDLKGTPCAKLNPDLFQEKPKKGKRPKYRNHKVEWEGMVFDSTKEYERYRELLLWQKAGVIGQLERQVKYELIPANETERKTEYWADHRYRMMDTGELVVEDVKSEATRKLSTYIMKRKLMRQIYNIIIKEV